MHDFRGAVRYLVHYSDGGSGMRYRDERLDVGAELDDGGAHYRVERVEPPPHGEYPLDVKFFFTSCLLSILSLRREDR